MSHQLFALSPLDGRYKNRLGHLGLFFSEAALMQYRLKVEVEYLIALAQSKMLPELKPFSEKLKIQMRQIVSDFGIHDAEDIKEHEQQTHHDVKAVEYYLKHELEQLSLFPESALPFIHFCCTSEDINNLSYGLMVKDALKAEYLPKVQALWKTLSGLSKKWSSIPLLALTHGQSATPTTLGKEMAVFAQRLLRQIEQVKAVRIMGKFGGATGNWNAQMIAYPKADWKNFSQKFIRSLGLEPNLLTTQIESHDWNAELFDAMKRINMILLGFSRDCWGYVSRGVFHQKVIEHQVGSSTMPHKVNPIDFENAEGNFELGSALLSKLSEKLQVSRFQRDLSDSTVQRSIGSAFGYCLLALDSLSIGIDKISPDRHRISAELNAHWEVLTEALQVVMRRFGVKNAYEKMKDLTRGKGLDPQGYQKFVDQLKIPAPEKERLRKLRPETYIGLADRLL